MHPEAGGGGMAVVDASMKLASASGRAASSQSSPPPPAWPRRADLGHQQRQLLRQEGHCAASRCRTARTNAPGAESRRSGSGVGHGRGRPGWPQAPSDARGDRAPPGSVRIQHQQQQCHRSPGAQRHPAQAEALGCWPTNAGTTTKPARWRRVRPGYSARPRPSTNQRPMIWVIAVPEIAAQPKAMPA